MTSLLATVRPDSWNFPLFLHVFGAMILIGGLFAGAGLLAYARGEAKFQRLGFWSLLGVGLPGLVLLWVGALWTYSKEGWDNVSDEPTWLGIGWGTATLGGILFLISLVLGGVGIHRLGSGRGSSLLKLTLAISIVLLAAYLVTVWAMAGKPD